MQRSSSAKLALGWRFSFIAAMNSRSSSSSIETSTFDVASQHPSPKCPAPLKCGAFFAPPLPVDYSNTS